MLKQLNNICLALLLLSSFSLSANTPPDLKLAKIYVLTSISETGISLSDTLELALESYQTSYKKQLPEHKVIIQREAYNVGDTKACFDKYEKIIKDPQALVIVGPLSSQCALEINKANSKPDEPSTDKLKHIPMIAVLTSAPDISQSTNPNFLRFTSNDNSRTEMLVRQAIENEPNTSAPVKIIYDSQDAYSQGLMEGVKKALIKLKGNELKSCEVDLNYDEQNSTYTENNAGAENCNNKAIKYSFIVGNSKFTKALFNDSSLKNKHIHDRVFTVGASSKIVSLLPVNSLVIGEHSLFEEQYKEVNSLGLNKYRKDIKTFKNNNQDRIIYMGYEAVASLIPDLLISESELTASTPYDEIRSVISSNLNSTFTVKSKVVPGRQFEIINRELFNAPALPIYSSAKVLQVLNADNADKFVIKKYENKYISWISPFYMSFSAKNFASGEELQYKIKSGGISIENPTYNLGSSLLSNDSYDYFFTQFNSVKNSSEELFIEFGDGYGLDPIKLEKGSALYVILGTLFFAGFFAFASLLFDKFTQATLQQHEVSLLLKAKREWIKSIKEKNKIKDDSQEIWDSLPFIEIDQITKETITKRFLEVAIVSICALVIYGHFLAPILAGFTGITLNLGEVWVWATFGLFGLFGMRLMEFGARLLKYAKIIT